MAVAAGVVASLSPLGLLPPIEGASPGEDDDGEGGDGGADAAEVSNSASTAFVLHDTIMLERMTEDDEEEMLGSWLCMTCGAGASLRLTSYPRMAM